ncbi:MAG: hypothetical protein MUF07_08495 [Steroidobacteraceae bacterium]|jgi:hypothetical protein|nr:hypothetical protein [Steroidobacteraceae bacterium]
MANPSGDTGRRHAAGGRRAAAWRALGWGVALLLLALPWVVQAPWTAYDHLVAGTIVVGIGLAFEALVRRGERASWRGGSAVALATAGLTVWINGAVGLIGPEDEPYDLVFAGVLLVALLGAGLARLRPAGLARAMRAAALAQCAASLGGAFLDARGAVFGLALAAGWLLAGALFRAAARSDGRAGPPQPQVPWAPSRARPRRAATARQAPARAGPPRLRHVESGHLDRATGRPCLPHASAPSAAPPRRPAGAAALRRPPAS